jgi:hypothetical protein
LLTVYTVVREGLSWLTLVEVQDMKCFDFFDLFTTETNTYSLTHLGPKWRRNQIMNIAPPTMNAANRREARNALLASPKIRLFK